MNIGWFLQGRAAAGAATAPAGSSSAARWAIWTTFLGLVVFAAWAHWAVLDEITRAPGAVIASSRTQVIQSQDGGTIADMMVREGDVVDAGQLLLKFDQTRAQASFLEARAKLAGLAASAARLRAEMLGGEPQYPDSVKPYPEFSRNQSLLFQKRRAALNEELQAIQGMMRLVRQELEMTEPLLKTGDVSRTDVLRLQRQLAEMQAQITNKRNKFFQDAQAELSKVQEDMASVEQTLAQRQSQVEFTELRAPVKGVVKNVRITTLGGVVRPGEEVMQIVPLEDDLVIEAKVSPADIAFLKPGLEVSVKLDAYDYTIYGDLQGQLVYISADTLSEDLRQGEQPYYRVQVRTQGRRFSARPNDQLDILPGMTASVEVKTGERTVLQYLLKPVVKTLSESLGER